MEIKSISKHRPKNMIIDIAENDAKAIIKTGEFIASTKENLIVKKEITSAPKPNIGWTEKEIDEWAEINAPEIDYEPAKHTKKYVLGKLSDGGYI